MISRRKRRNLASASPGAIAALLFASPAFAEQQNACGDLADGEISCPADGTRYDQGIRYDAFGDITVNLGDGLSLTPETGSAAIIAISQVNAGGSVTINGAQTTIHTRDAIGAVVEAEGDVLIDLASVSTEAATPGEIAVGIFAVSTFGSTTVKAGSVSTAGDYARGIVVENGGPGSVRIDAGSIATSGFASDGVAVIAGGLTEIRVDTIEGRGDAIWGVNVDNGVSFQEELVSGDTFIDIGRIDLAGDANAGVVLTSYGSAEIAIGALDIEGQASTGVHASVMGSVRVEVGEATFRGEQTGGIAAAAINGDAIVKVGSLSSESGSGVSAASYAGAAIVEAGSIHVNGDFAPGAAAASNYGNASVRVADVSTNGMLAHAISARAMRGELAIVAGTVAVRGEGAYGIQATGQRNLIQLDGALTTSGDRGVGILSSTTRGDNVVLAKGDIATLGGAADGMRLTGRYGSAIVRASGTISTAGDVAAGVRATGEDGQVAIEAQAIATSGAGANGIHARTRYIEYYIGYFPGEPVPFTGNIDIRAANVTVTGAGSAGISAKGIGDAAIIAGNVSATSGPAIETDMIGAVSIDLLGGVRADETSGVLATGADISIDIAANARVFGGQDGLVVNAIGPRCVMREPTDGSPNPCPNPGNDEFGGGIGFGGAPFAEPGTRAGFAGNARIVNRGTIEAGSGFALRAVTGAVALENHGTVVGAVQFSGGDDLFDNRGLFVVTKDSDFGGGIDIFRNEGALRFGGGQARLDGLDRFENKGTIDLRNGAAGDVLTLAGDYVGSEGAAVQLDIDGAGRAADRLVIAGSASGSTLIALAAAPREARLTDPDGILLIEVDGTSSADAFTLAEATRDIGLVRYALAYDPASGGFSLVGRAGAGAYRQLGTLQASDHMWDASADLWRLNGLARRDALFASLGGGDTPRLWGSLQGGRVSRDWRSGEGSDTFDLDYRQTRRGGQLGYDLLGREADASTVRLGLTGGYSTATLGFRGGGERIKLSTANIGLYASYVGERLFANLLVKYDDHDIKVDTAAFASTEELGGSTWGAESEIGLRLGNSGMFVEPAIGLAWTRTGIDGLGGTPQSIAFEDSEQVKARLGARFGGTNKFSDGGALTLYASANAVRLFGSNYALTVTSGSSQRIEGKRLGTFGEGRLGLAYRTAGGFELFLEGQGDVGSGYDGLTGRAGFRVGF